MIADQLSARASSVDLDIGKIYGPFHPNISPSKPQKGRMMIESDAEEPNKIPRPIGTANIANRI
jgi:hypothetical protein